MFDDDSDDEDDDNVEAFNSTRASALADSVAQATSVPVAQATSVAESSRFVASQEPAAPAATEMKSSLFQAGSFAGMDMDLFSDEDDD
jgi:hypothetical protein